MSETISTLRKMKSFGVNILYFQPKEKIAIPISLLCITGFGVGRRFIGLKQFPAATLQKKTLSYGVGKSEGISLNTALFSTSQSLAEYRQSFIFYILMWQTEGVQSNVLAIFHHPKQN